MKKILIIMLISMLAFSSAACSAETSPAATDADKSNQTETVNPDTSEPAQTVATESKTGFEQFEEGLNEAGLSYEKVTMGADLIEAEEGYKYKLENGKAELYRFNPDSDALKSATENKSVELQGFGSFPVEMNGHFALLTDLTGADKDKILEIFEKIS